MTTDDFHWELVMGVPVVVGTTRKVVTTEQIIGEQDGNPLFGAFDWARHKCEELG